MIVIIIIIIIDFLKITPSPAAASPIPLPSSSVSTYQRQRQSPHYHQHYHRHHHHYVLIISTDVLVSKSSIFNIVSSYNHRYHYQHHHCFNCNCLTRISLTILLMSGTKVSKDIFKLQSSSRPLPGDFKEFRFSSHLSLYHLIICSLHDIYL